MKRRGNYRALVVVAILALMGALANAEEISEAIPGERSDRNFFVTAGAGVAFLNGNTGWALQFGGLGGIDDFPGLYVGADLGLNFWSFTSVSGATAQVSSRAVGVQLLPTAIFRFDVADNSAVHPYLGVSIGPNLYFETVGDTSDSSLLFEALFRPGMYMGLTRDVALNLEAKLGLLGGDFIFLPVVAAGLSL